MDKRNVLGYTQTERGNIMRNILKYIKTLALRSIAVLTVALIIVIIVMIIIPFKAVISPKSAASAEEVAELYTSGKKYVNAQELELTYAGYDQMNGEEAVASYYYIVAEDFTYKETETDVYIFFLIPVDETEEHASTIVWSGKTKILKNSTTAADFITAFAEDEGLSEEDITAEPGGFVASGYDYSAAAIIIWLVIFILLLIAIIIALVMSLVTYFKPLYGRTFRRLKKFSDGRESAGVIRKQLRSSETKKYGNIFITQDYFVGYTNTNVYVVPLENIMRAVRPAGKKAQVIIDTEPRAKYKIRCKSKKQADAVVEAIRSIF